MNTWRMIFKEMAFRKVASLSALLAVAVAVAALVGALMALDVHRRQDERVLAEHEEQVDALMAELKDEMRKATLKLSYNLLILPKDQNLRDWYTDDFATEYMPEEYVDRLSAASLMTVQHLLPTLQQRVEWPEQNGRSIILIGTRGYVSNVGQAPKKPLDLGHVVPTGGIVLGYQLQQALAAAEGDVVRVLGRAFRVHRCHEERGSKDDISAWISLAEAQDLLNRPGRINAMLALKCMSCPGVGLGSVRAEVAGVLPDTQVVEMGSPVLARYEARSRVGDEAKAALKQQREDRATMQSQRETLAGALSPVLMLVAAAWLALWAFRDMRLRRAEYGLLRAIGVRAGRVLAMFLSKAALVGLLGGVAGYAAGIVLGLYLGGGTDVAEAFAPANVLRPAWITLALTAALAISILGVWIPAILAARTDPAVILREGGR
ncbi:MAG: ABC transporter permease [Patescibacteria group bacterium]|nr:ABC transporter permease [Patescibacteria group bacterium]